MAAGGFYMPLYIQVQFLKCCFYFWVFWRLRDSLHPLCVKTSAWFDCRLFLFRFAIVCFSVVDATLFITASIDFLFWSVLDKQRQIVALQNVSHPMNNVLTCYFKSVVLNYAGCLRCSDLWIHNHASRTTWNIRSIEHSHGDLSTVIITFYNCYAAN